MKRAPSLRAIIKSVAFFFGTIVAELVGVFTGIIRLDGVPKADAANYMQIPVWIYLAAPAIIGVYVFFRSWYHELEAQPRHKAIEAPKHDEIDG